MPILRLSLFLAVTLTVQASAQSSSRSVPMAAEPSYPGAINQGIPVVQPGSGTRIPTVQPSRIIQQSTAQPSTTMGSGTRTLPANVGSFEQKLWNYLLRAKYRNWAPVPGKSDAMYEGQSPHGAFLKMYLNRKAAGNPTELPSGSIVIKENYGPDQKSLMAITAMYKTNGYNPKAGDWYWVKFNPDGSVANKSTDSGLTRLAGRVNGCISCHEGAEGGDFAYFND